MPRDVPVDPQLDLALADRYELRRELGQGGMATVYLAHDRKHHREVALKVLRPALAAVLGVERFLNEIQLDARLTHPHILALYDSGAASGFLFYVMPFLEGESLRRRLGGGRRLGVDEALAIAAPVADALAYAHRMGIYHRDIKPENILFSQGHPIVADFGIAKAISTAGGDHLTRTGFPLGTPGYMSPEQAAGLTELDARTDVYSLAVVIYEMLVGEIPPPGRWPSDAALEVGRFLDAPPLHRQRLADLGSRVEAALVRGLAPRPHERSATPPSLMHELQGGAPPSARRRFSEGEVQEIMRRATELEASHPTPGSAMTIGSVEALGAEVGLAPELVREAARSLSALGPTPRELKGAVAARFRDVAYSPWQLMDPTTPPHEGWGVTDLLSVIFFSILTAGVLPLVFIGLSRARKRRLRVFFAEGVPALAEIVDFREEEVGFEVKLTRVRYEFGADGQTRRGSDLTLPVVADRWRAGDRIEILYMPSRDYDSVIATSR
ncbi:MAG: serine/threonine-protein kinase [Gemmatimonadales bacterium]